MLRNTLLRAAGAMGAWAISRRLTRQMPRIFMFHRFASLPQSGRTHTDQFTQFLDKVGECCEFVTIGDLVDRIAQGTRLQKPLACITVDDGHADFYQVALPILAERRIPATLYATAGFVEGYCWLWWDALRYLLDAVPVGKFILNASDQQFEFMIDDPASRQAAWSKLANHAVYRNDDRAQFLAYLESVAGISLPKTPPPLYASISWEQLIEAQSAGIEIGAHTMTHAYLPALDIDQLEFELLGAKQLLEKHICHSVRSFAYPNGAPDDYSPQIEAALRRCGFDSAVLAYPRKFNPSDRYKIGRWSSPSSDSQLDHILYGVSDLKLAFNHL